MEQLILYLSAPNTIRYCKSDIAVIAQVIINYLSPFEIIDFDKLLNNIVNVRNITIIDDNKTEKIKPSLTKSMLMDDVITASKLKPFENSSSDNIFNKFCIQTWNRNNEKYFINFIDSSHNYFNSLSYDVQCSLRLTDGALFVIDCIKGIGLNTQFCIKKCIEEHNEPILFINGIDKLLKGNKSNEECYQILLHHVQSMNKLWNNITKVDDEKQCEFDQFPVSKIVFGSSLYEFSFTLETFAKFNDIDADKLWGHNYLDKNEAKWYSEKNKNNIHGFDKFIWNPIKTIFEVVKHQKDVKTNILEPMNLMLNEEQIPINDTDDALKIIFNAWLPIRRCILDTIIQWIPSPIKSQQQKIQNIYKGPIDSDECSVMMNCDKKGPVSMQITKIIPNSVISKNLAFGRIFSGTIKTGQEIRILGPDYIVGKKRDLYIKKISNIQIITSSGFTQKISECPAGNICCIDGIDDYILKQASVTTSSTMYPMKIYQGITPVCKVTVGPIQATELPQFILGLKQIIKKMSCIHVYASSSGEHIISGLNQKHILCAIKELKACTNNMKLEMSQIFMSLRETIINKTGEDGIFPTICVSKSPNKHNRIYLNAQPMDDCVVEKIERYGADVSKTIISDVDEKDVWMFGYPPDGMANCIVNQTKNVKYLNEVKDHITSAFIMSSANGVLCDEPLRGIRFNLIDVTLHPDLIQRGAGQLMPTVKRAIYATELASSPRLMIPMYLVYINIIKSKKCVILDLLEKCNSVIKDENEYKDELFEDFNGDFGLILAEISVVDMCNFERLLSSDIVKDNEIEYRMKLHGWKSMETDPFVTGSESNMLLTKTRERNGFPAELPVFYDYYDRI